MDAEIIEFVKRSQYRQRVLTSLDRNVLMQKEIAKRSNIKTNHVSKVLSDLKNKELVDKIIPEAHKRRIYRLTDKGEEVIKNMD